MEEDNSAMGTPAGDDATTPATDMPATEMPAEGGEHTDEAV